MLLLTEPMFCPICLETFPSGVRTMCCNKRHHKSCLDQWLARDNTTCPLCRGDPKRVLKRYPLMAKTPKYCSECCEYGFLFCKTLCCGKNMHIPCSNSYSCDFCLDKKRYFYRYDLNNLPFQTFFARLVVDGRVEYLYNYEVVGAKAIKLATALKRKTVNHQGLRRVLRLAYCWSLKEGLTSIYYHIYDGPACTLGTST